MWIATPLCRDNPSWIMASPATYQAHAVCCSSGRRFCEHGTARHTALPDTLRLTPSPTPMPTTATIDDLLAGLNPRQREAATHGDSPLLIVAGAEPERPPRWSIALPG